MAAMAASSWRVARRRTRSTVSSSVVLKWPPVVFSSNANFVVAPPSHTITVAALGVDRHHHLAHHGAQQLLALAPSGGRRVEDGAHVGPCPGEPRRLLVAQLRRA